MSQSNLKSAVAAVQAVGAKKKTSVKKSTISKNSPEKKLIDKILQSANDAANKPDAKKTGIININANATSKVIRKTKEEKVVKTVKSKKETKAKSAVKTSNTKDKSLQKKVSKNSIAVKKGSSKTSKTKVATSKLEDGLIFNDLDLGKEGNTVNFMMNSFEHFQGQSADIVDNFYQARNTIKENMELMFDSAYNTIGDVSSAYVEAASSSPSDIIDVQREYASKVQSAYSDTLSIVGKASYSNFKELFSIFLPYCQWK